MPRSSILPEETQSTMRFAAARPMIRNTRNSNRNNPARNFAIANETPAIDVNPSKGGNQPDHQEHQSHVEHDITSSSHSRCQSRAGPY
jgi:hypothetical protein